MQYIWLILPILIFAGVVRGYSGFGFAAIAIVGVNLFFKPQQSVAIILAIDLLCSIPLFRLARDNADYPTLKLLTTGAVIGIPFGYAVLQLVPAELLKLLICCVILLLSLLLFSEFRPFDAEKSRNKLTLGIVAGVCTSSASVGGPIIIYYMLSSRLSTTQQRATMILFFIISESVAFVTLLVGGAVDSVVPTAVAILIIPTLIAVRFGQSLFHKKPPKSLKSFALPVIIVVALLGIVKSAVILLH